jgi:pyruvate dehydrogenase E2 component (dihydrolipoamide acetyltransferase)
LAGGASSSTPSQQAAAPQQQSQPEQQQSQQSEAPSAGSIPEGISEIKMPALSPTMTKGNIAKWNKQEGDKLSPGDVLCQVETDKAVVEFEFQEEGYLGKILIPEGTNDVELFSVIALLAEDKNALARAADYKPGQSGASASSQQQSAPQQQQQTTSAPQQQQQQQKQTTQSGGRVFASPLAKKVANESGVDLSAIGSGSGPNGRIIKDDVDAFVASGKQQQQTQQQQPARAQQTQQPRAPTTGVDTGDFTDIPVSGVRKIIANRLLESKQTIPHYYLSVECEIDALMKLRAQLNKFGEKRGYKLSVNDFIIKASAAAMKKVPEVNSSWRGDYIRQFNNADISVAVQTDNGLITPIVFNAEAKGLSDISNNVKTLAEKARNGKLQPQEFQGGTFTISNLGMVCY